MMESQSPLRSWRVGRNRGKPYKSSRYEAEVVGSFETRNEGEEHLGSANSLLCQSTAVLGCKHDMKGHFFTAKSNFRNQWVANYLCHHTVLLSFCSSLSLGWTPREDMGKVPLSNGKQQKLEQIQEVQFKSVKRSLVIADLFWIVADFLLSWSPQPRVENHSFHKVKWQSSRGLRTIFRAGVLKQAREGGDLKYIVEPLSTTFAVKHGRFKTVEEGGKWIL